VERRQRALGSAISPLSYRRPLHLERGEGVWLYDVTGRAYLDAYNNVPVVGHSHPRVVEAIARQAARLNTNPRYLYEPIVELAERLTATMPAGLDTCLFVNSGSEANDLAWRLAIAATGGSGAVVTANAYHGVTTVTADLSPEEWLDDTRPGHVETIPAPDGYRGAHRREDPGWGARYAEALGAAVDDLGGRGHRLAAVYLDGGLTSDGILAPPPEYARGLAERARAAGGLYVADEVQAGHGRTGAHLWAFAAAGVVPDIVTTGKPMGNGFPVAAVVTRADIVDRLAARTEWFSTFGGNPVACAAALAVLDVIEEEDILAGADAVGAHLRAGLADLAARHDGIGDVRGSGLLIGVELVRDREHREPATDLAADVVEALRDRGVLVGRAGPADNVLKIRPPLVFRCEHADLLVERLDEVLVELARAR
jgi:4-aminobutyrate aminotransferase-like enzyme